jgi:chemotaxis protein CheD
MPSLPAMLAALGVRRERFDEVEVALAGGARMLRLPAGEDAIGRRNIMAAHAQLAARGLMVSQEDVGASQGRRLSIDCARMAFSIERMASDQGRRRILAPMS